MLRILGSALIFTGVCRLAWERGNELRRKEKNLRSLLGALEQLRSELSFQMTQLPSLLYRIGLQREDRIGQFLKDCGRQAKEQTEDFQDFWEREVTDLGEHLDERALSVLHQLGRGIGRYDWETEERLLSTSIMDLRRLLQETGQEVKNRIRLYQTLGVTAGAFLVVLFL